MIHLIPEKLDPDVKADLAKLKPGDFVAIVAGTGADGKSTVEKVSTKRATGLWWWGMICGVIFACIMLMLIAWKVPATQENAIGLNGQPIVVTKPGGIRSLLVGEDNRYSNSKVQAVFWMIALLIAYFGTAVIRWSSGMPWEAGLNITIPESLLTIAAISVATAGGAKIATATKVANADAAAAPAGAGPTTTTAKPSAEKPRFLRDLFYDDNGKWDSSDAQMAAVTVISLAMFGYEVLSLWNNLPLTASGTLPAPGNVMAAVFGGSLAGYLSNKIGMKFG